MRSGWTWKVAAATGAIVFALGTGSASAANVTNGDFETGTLRGWDKDFFGPGAWVPYGTVMRGVGFLPPPQGEFGAVSDQGEPSAMFLSQVVKLKADRRHKLKFRMAYFNDNTAAPRGSGMFPGFWTPNHFRFGKAARPNQQFRMDVMEPDAPIKSLKDKHVLKNVYTTERGDADAQPYRRIRANLTKFAGQKVRLRFAVAVTEEELNVGIDAVKVKTKR